MRGTGTTWVWTAMALALGCSEAPVPEGSLEPGDAGPDPDAGTPERPPPTQREPTPPAISGGTMALVDGGHLAIVSDVDFDRVVGVDLDSGDLAWSLPLGGGSHPFRIAEGPGGVVYVTLRAKGEVLAIDARSGTELGRRRVCASPRGVTWDHAAGLWHVACVEGVLVSLASVDEEPSRTLELGVDLRDVVVNGEHTFVSRFRSAEVLVLDSAGAIVETMVPPPAIPRTPTTGGGAAAFDGEPNRTHDDFDVTLELGRGLVPNSAYRMRPMPGGGVALLHQRSSSNVIFLSATGTESSDGMRDGAYGGSRSPSCGSRLAHAAVTVLVPSRPARTSRVIEEAVVPADFAYDPSSAAFVVVAAGSDVVFSAPLPDEEAGDIAFPACDVAELFAMRMPTAIDVRADGRAVFFARGTQELRDAEGGIARLAPEPLWEDIAFHEFFTRVGRAPMACATCHPEGAEDGHVWHFEGVGPRRTQTTAGNIVGTAPFHWSGDVPDMDVIIDTNMERMGRSTFEGRAPTAAFERLLAALDAPASPRAAEDEQALAGREVFESAGCPECHSGDLGTNNRTVDVGTGEPFQVPHLVGVAHRAPFFHDGCAPTLRSVLEGCETHEAGAHAAGTLTEAQKELLVAYLESR